MNTKQLLDKIDNAWGKLQESYKGLTKTQILQPGVIGEWSIKDIIGHVTTWEEEALKCLPMILLQRSLPHYRDLYGGLNAFNAMMSEKKRGFSLSEIMRQSEMIHQQLISYISSAPEEMFTTETRFRRRIRLDTYSHYPMHAKAIREWRETSKY